VKVDGQTITAGSQYTATSGSTIISLKSGYLDTSAVGTHSLAVSFNGNVTANSTFEILAAKSDDLNNKNSDQIGVPSTGLMATLSKNLMPLAIVAVLVIAAAIAPGMSLKKQRQNTKFSLKQ
jgi:hypothetical protein